MRISDWSADVCSSDLSAASCSCLTPTRSKRQKQRGASRAHPHPPPRLKHSGAGSSGTFSRKREKGLSSPSYGTGLKRIAVPAGATGRRALPGFRDRKGPNEDPADVRRHRAGRDRRLLPAVPLVRSEEPTSELQSLMRISYDVVRLK